jgi:hypothetical protein
MPSILKLTPEQEAELRQMESAIIRLEEANHKFNELVDDLKQRSTES